MKAIIFDLGAVLIDWNPEYLYHTIFSEKEEIKHFLENICTSEWNEEQDNGRSLKDGTDLLVAQYPDHAQNIRAFYGQWQQMLGGAIEGTVDIFAQLKSLKRYKFYALTNWSAETFPIALERYDFLNWFDGIVVSGEEKMRKPFNAFYQVLLDRYNLQAADALFIDDNYRNIVAAEAMGFSVIHFSSPPQLLSDLKNLKVIE